MGKIIRNDGRFNIELNENYPEDMANMFLQNEKRCIGGADLQAHGENKGEWLVSVEKPYDEAEDSDCRVVGFFGDRERAISALWGERHSVEVQGND